MNAAKTSLRGGSGIDGAIHAAAGPRLLAACLQQHPNGCPVGQARSTPGFNLPAQYVIHTVGPVWSNSTKVQATPLLRSAYDNSFQEAQRLNVSSVAIPCISTGIYGFPSRDAAHVAFAAARTFLAGPAANSKVHPKHNAFIPSAYFHTFPSADNRHLLPLLTGR